MFSIRKKRISFVALVVISIVWLLVSAQIGNAIIVPWHSNHPPKDWTIGDKMKFVGISPEAGFPGKNAEYLAYSREEFKDLEGTLIYCSSGLGHPWRAAQARISTEFVKQLAPKVRFIIMDAKWDPQTQISQMRTAIASKPNVLGLVPHTAAELTPVTREAMRSGIPVVTWDRKVNCPVTVHVGPTDEWSSRDACRIIAKILNGKGNIIELVGTPGATPTVKRHKYFVDEMKKYPGLKMIASHVCDYLREPAMKFMEDALVRFGPGKIQAIYAHNDEMALGAIAAIEAAGRQNEGIIIVAHDGENEAINAIVEGKMIATHVYHYVAPEGVIVMLKILEGVKLPREIILPSCRIDKNTAEKWIGMGF